MYFLRGLLAVLVTGAISPDAQAALLITLTESAYTQSFDTLPASGSATWTNDSTLSGWYHARTGAGTTIVADNGANTAGNLYSYGTGTNPERALGSVGSGTAAGTDSASGRAGVDLPRH